MKNIGILLILLVSAVLASCGKEEKDRGGVALPPEIKNLTRLESLAPGDLPDHVGQKVSLSGSLTGEAFTHRVFFYPPYTEMAHFNLDKESPLGGEISHLVIYFKKNTIMSEIYQKYMDKPAVISGTLQKVDGSFLNPDPSEVQARKAHTEYFLAVEKISLLEE